MFRKLIFIISFAAVLGSVGTASADLVAWWRFDDGSGTTAVDSSGNGNDGTLTGGATWTNGYFGGAIQFNGTNSYVAAPHIPFDNQSFTITMWINPVLYTDQQVVFGQVQSGSQNLSMHFRLGGPGGTGPPPGAVRMGFYSNDLNSPDGLIQDNNWYHLTFWYDVSGPTRRIYVDGVQVAEDAGAPYQGTTGETRIGQWNNNQWFQGIIDDVQIYNNPLTDAEIQASMHGIKGFPKAGGESPEDGAMVEATWATMSWRAGDFAVSHDVYFGDNFDDVNSGAEAAFQGNKLLTDTNLIVGFMGFPYPDGLVPGTTYYWRIDEVNDAEPNSPWVGDVWSFTVPPREAYSPTPSNNARFVDIQQTLTWQPGLDAKLHNIVFGDNYDDVNNAPAGSPVSGTSYTPGTLENGKTYYWRVDEFNPPTTVKGKVWSFTTIPEIPITDPNLVGWWKFDEGQGTIALDWSGHGNHGVLNGDPQWVSGRDGGALEFDGTGDFVNCGNGPTLTITNDITFMCWIKVAAFSKTWETILAKGDDSYRMSRGPSDGDSVHFGCNGPSGGNLTANTIVTTDTWRHIAMVYDGMNKITYIDGVEDARVASTGNINVSNYDLYIGANSQQSNRNLTGLVDDVRIYNKALTPDEIKQAMRGDTSRSWDPSPHDNAISDVVRAASLSWSPGDKASQHAVYFGTDRDAVTAADESDTTGVFKGLQAATSYVPEGITMGSGPYYWRVDEHNTDGTITKGNVWSFTVAGYLIVDDFESYNDTDNLVYERYQDGFANPNINGSTIGYPTGASMETSNVRSGDQSVPFIYNNTTAPVSEVTLNITPAQDWTVNGVQTLSLWFAGDPANVPGQFYVKINGVQVNYDGDASNLARGVWQVWNVDLTAVGTNMSNVTSFAFGIQGAGASGTLLLDDIRLYAQLREFITPVQPSNEGLVAYYSFDGNTNDSVGGNNGTPSGGPLYFAGKVGQAISLDGIDDFVSTGKFASELGIDGNKPRTITVWVYTRGFLNGGIYDVGNRVTAQDFCLRTLNDVENQWRVQYWGGDYDFIYPTKERWVHFTHVHDGTHTKIYADGLLIVDWEKTIDTTDDNPFQIGCYGWQNDYFNGMIDELRLYDRALMAEEAAGAAGITQPFDKPFED